jgi:hypothetical protein
VKTFLVALLLIYAAPAFGGWVGSVSPKHLVSRELASIQYSPSQGEGTKTFKEAVDALARSGKVDRLEVITLSWLVQDPSFQKELMSSLQKVAPKELAEAMRSAGNIHNPRIDQLRRPFEDAVLATPTINSINADLSPYGLYVSGASTEKAQHYRQS